MKTIITGSRAFFSMYNDFNPKDKDIIYIIEDDSTKHSYSYTHVIGVCKIILTNLTKEQLFKIYDKKQVASMSICNFLVPEFVEYFGITIEDLKHFKTYIDTLDNKHLYLRIIYKAYLENGKFELTQEQRDRAYSSYKSWRPDFYK